MILLHSASQQLCNGVSERRKARLKRYSVLLATQARARYSLAPYVLLHLSCEVSKYNKPEVRRLTQAAAVQARDIDRKKKARKQSQAKLSFAGDEEDNVDEASNGPPALDILNQQDLASFSAVAGHLGQALLKLMYSPSKHHPLMLSHFAQHLCQKQVTTCCPLSTTS